MGVGAAGFMAMQAALASAMSVVIIPGVVSVVVVVVVSVVVSVVVAVAVMVEMVLQDAGQAEELGQQVILEKSRDGKVDIPIAAGGCGTGAGLPTGPGGLDGTFNTMGMPCTHQRMLVGMLFLTFDAPMRRLLCPQGLRLLRALPKPAVPSQTLVYGVQTTCPRPEGRHKRQ